MDRCCVIVGLWLGVSDSNLAETQATRLAARTETGLENSGHQTTVVAQVNCDTSDHRRVAPDMMARETGELEAPAASDRHSAQDR